MKPELQAGRERLTAKCIAVIAGILLCVMGGSFALASDFERINWRLAKDKQGIQVYTGRVANSKHRAVFSTFTGNIKLASAIALVRDLENCGQWSKTCKLARYEQVFSSQDSVVYSQANLPFPVRNRDSYSRVRWVQDANTRAVTMRSTVIGVSGQYPKKKGYIRLENAQFEWRFIPNSTGELMIESYAHIDPNGIVPAWLSNRLIIDEPYKALKRMRKLLIAGAYDKAQLPF